MKAETVRRLLALSSRVVITAASAPRSCAVCRGDQDVAVQRPDIPPSWAGVMPCPHCVLGVPVVDLPWLADQPRQEAPA